MNKHLSSRTADQVAQAMAQLTPMVDAGLQLFPLAPRSKVPRDTGWREADYSDFDPEDWLRKGGNIGVRLRAQDLVLDIDPRNGGDESWKTLNWEVGEGYPTVRTGSGGLHVYLTKPADVLVRGKVPGHPGVDVKALGGFVVAPGSIHPDTGELYGVESGSFSAINAVPGLVLDKLRRPPPKERTADSGAVSPEQLAVLLAVLNPSDFSDYDSWLTISAACHDAVDGNPEGMAVWLEWCARDAAYGPNAMRVNEMKWDTFTAGRAGGVTSATLFKAVIDAGHSELVAQLGYNAAEEFDDDIPEQVAEADEADRKRATRFKRWSFGDLLTLPPPEWLVDGMVPEESLVQLYGRRKSNKTFVALDMALCIATGRPFHGIGVRRGRVTYVIGEGGGARFGDRIMAWCKHNHVAPADLDDWFFVVPQRVGVDNKTDLQDFLAGDAAQCALVVFDTLARSMDGDENSTPDMNRLVKGLDRVREHYHGTTLVVHHSGKDETKQGRGNTVLPSAVDATIKVSRNAAGQTVMEVEESRNAAPDTKLTFQSVSVVVGDDLRSSLAMRLVGSATEASEPKTAKDLVLVRIAEAGRAQRGELVDPDTTGMSKANVNKAIKALLEEELLVEDNGGLRVTEDGENAALALGAVVPQ